MLIIFGQEKIKEFKHKYTVLELDTIRFGDQSTPVTAYCMVESVPITEMADVNQYRDLHNNLMKNYRLKNWKFCEDALEHLVGKWNKELDTFYLEISNRIKEFKSAGVAESWDGIIDQTKNTVS